MILPSTFVLLELCAYSAAYVAVILRLGLGTRLAIAWTLKLRVPMEPLDPHIRDGESQEFNAIVERRDLSTSVVQADIRTARLPRDTQCSPPRVRDLTIWEWSVSRQGIPEPVVGSGIYFLVNNTVTLQCGGQMEGKERG